jgi:precorrin-2 dehydrogenase/sirohydrochlorin ferrochelatase
MPLPVYYPIFLNLKKKKCVVVGGGKIAERKVLSLLKANADVTVISPSLTERLKKESSCGKINHISREYRKGDLKNAFLVIAATASDDINKRVSENATNLINVVDTPSMCNFIVPSVIRRGLLTIAISTSGVSPALSKTIRKEIERLYGPAFGRYLGALKKIREKAMIEIKDKKKRERFFKKLAADTYRKRDGIMKRLWEIEKAGCPL